MSEVHYSPSIRGPVVGRIVEAILERPIPSSLLSLEIVFLALPQMLQFHFFLGKISAALLVYTG